MNGSHSGKGESSTAWHKTRAEPEKMFSGGNLKKSKIVGAKIKYYKYLPHHPHVRSVTATKQWVWVPSLLVHIDHSFSFLVSVMKY